MGLTCSRAQKIPAATNLICSEVTSQWTVSECLQPHPAMTPVFLYVFFYSTQQFQKHFR